MLIYLLNDRVFPFIGDNFTKDPESFEIEDMLKFKKTFSLEKLLDNIELEPLLLKKV